MNAPERALNLDATTATSGVHTRSSFETPLHRPEDEDLRALVQRASSRPPAPPADHAEIEIPRLPPLMMDGLPGLLVPPPLSIAPAAKSPSLSAGVKAMIALPWALLVVGGATVAMMWPRPEGGPLTQTVAAHASSLAPAVVEAAEPSLAVAVAAAQPGAAVEPTLVEALRPAVASAQREPREPSAQPGSTAVEVNTASGAPTGAPPATEAASTAPGAEAAVVAAAPAQGTVAAAPGTPAAAAPATAPNGTTFEAIQARLAAGGGTAAAAPVAGESTLPERPSRAEVVRALRSVQSAVDACTTDVGTAMVRITVAGDGTVTAASATGDYAGTPAGSCMADAVRGARFSPFTASTMTVTYPFVLR